MIVSENKTVEGRPLDLETRDTHSEYVNDLGHGKGEFGIILNPAHGAEVIRALAIGGAQVEA